MNKIQCKYLDFMREKESELVGSQNRLIITYNYIYIYILTDLSRRIYARNIQVLCIFHSKFTQLYEKLHKIITIDIYNTVCRRFESRVLFLFLLIGNDPSLAAGACVIKRNTIYDFEKV